MPAPPGGHLRPSLPRCPASIPLLAYTEIMAARLAAVTPRRFALAWLAGLAAALLLTWWLRAGNSASVAFVFVCSVDNVPPPDFPDVLFTFALEPLPVFLLLSAAAASSPPGGSPPSSSASGWSSSPSSGPSPATTASSSSST